MCRRSNRRSLLKSAAAVSLAAPALAGGMGLSRVPRASAQGDSPLAGKTIDMTILGIAGWPPSRLGVDLAQDLFKPWAKENLGYDVNFSFEEAPFESLFQKAATSLQSQSAQYNIIISDSQWLGALAEPGWIVKLNDIIAANPDLDIKFVPTAQIAYRVYPDGSDNLYGFPQEGDVIALFVRQDLMSDQAERDAYKAANGGEDLPQTFEEWEQVDIDRYERVCKHFTRPDDNLYGAALQWSKVYDFISCYTYPFMWSTGGEAWDPATGQVQGILDTEENAKGLERCKSFLQYAPPGATNFGIPEEVDIFTAGTVATCWQWAAVGPQMMNLDTSPGAAPGAVADESKVIRPDQVLIVPPPGFKGPDGDLTRVYTVGGQPWVINAFNDEDHMQVSIDYMKFWYLPETQLEYSRRGGNSAVQAVLDDPNWVTMQPHFRAYKYMLDRSRDFWHDPNYAEMLSIQQEAWSAYVTDVVTDPMLALQYTACKQQQILYDAGRSEIEASGECADISLG
ncbi:MAG: extracellular solute-binding protein [Thermomicrobiales bacterium]|nr:extracellular solute-binding protein [Thermomicrobiales bacterium]